MALGGLGQGTVAAFLCRFFKLVLLCFHPKVHVQKGDARYLPCAWGGAPLGEG